MMALQETRSAHVSDEQVILHASCVAFNGQSILITGASGAGKSTLALQLLAYGGGLVADDRTVLTRDGEAVFADSPVPLRGMIEARGLGLLGAAAVGPAKLAAVVDLNEREADRLPDNHEIFLLGLGFPLLRSVEGPHFAPALRQFVLYGRGA